MIVVGDLAADCDAIEGPSSAKREPHLVIGTHTPTASDKLRLAFSGYALGQQSHSRPSSGVIVPFGESPKRVKLEPLYPTVKQAINRLRGLVNDPPAEAPP